MKILAFHLSNKQIDLQKWDQFIESSPQGSIYMKSWYLETLCKSWGAIIVQQGSLWKAVMPIIIKSKYGISYALQPLFTQYLGIAFTQPCGEKHHQLFEKTKIINEIIQTIPKSVRLYEYHFNPSFSSFLPFIQNNFDALPGMTYKVNLDTDSNSLIRSFSSSILNHLKKAKREELYCFESDSENPLLQIILKRKIIRESEASLFRNIWREVIIRKLGFILYVKDKDEKIHCGAAFVIDNDHAIMLLSAVDINLKRSGANALLITESIKRLNYLGNLKYIDFKGSCLKNVEQYLRGFNPEQVTYYKFRKNSLSVFVNMVHKIKNNIRSAVVIT